MVKCKWYSFLLYGSVSKTHKTQSMSVNTIHWLRFRAARFKSFDREGLCTEWNSVVFFYCENCFAKACVQKIFSILLFHEYGCVCVWVCLFIWVSSYIFPWNYNFWVNNREKTKKKEIIKETITIAIGAIARVCFFVLPIRIHRLPFQCNFKREKKFRKSCRIYFFFSTLHLI